MKKWLETREVLDRLAELSRGGKGAALATVVRVRGSAYRHEGAKMLVAEDGSTTGNVSGGCLEADVREVALRVLRSGEPELRSYCAGSDEIAAWDLGVGCEGKVEVLVARASEPRATECDLLAGTAPFASCMRIDVPERRLVVTRDGVHGSLVGTEFDADLDAHLDGEVGALARQRLDGGESALLVVTGRDVFVDVLAPPPRLIIVSGGADAQPLARFASEIGFRVIVVDRRPGLLTRERFPWAELVVVSAEELIDELATCGGPSGLATSQTFSQTFAVVMTHTYADDRAYLGALLDTNVAYIGVLGPRRRTERMLSELTAKRPVDEGRVYGPVGLDIGTDGAEQVALSALSEILAVRSGREPASLRERRSPIHADVRS